ncbi:hypothetical protein DXG01_000879 [Tephrocybe rancida]|nr:hypothetical protein DXG01_000879 [Tephrocybe rancida]
MGNADAILSKNWLGMTIHRIAPFWGAFIIKSTVDASYKQGQASTEPTLMQHLDYALMPASPVSLQHEQSSMGEEEESEPLSAYARWKLEEDERFYTTFPEARCAAQQYNTISSAYLVGTGYYYDADGHIARSDETTFYNDPPSPYSTYDDDTTSPEPPLILQDDYRYDFDYSNSDLARALAPTSRDGATKSTSTSSHYNVATPPPPPPVEIMQTSVVVPSQQPLPPPEPLMDSLPSPTSSIASSSSTSYTAHAHNMPLKNQYPSMAYADPSLHHMHMHAYPKFYNYYPPSTPQAGWPMMHPHRSIRLSPLSPTRRPIVKKPPLACLFCRGRKIACGPPDPGSTDRSCK